MTTANRYGIDSMFYTGNSPWQGVGTPLDGAATAEEAIVAAGLDWEVGLRRAYVETSDGQLFEDPITRGWPVSILVRSSSTSVIGTNPSRTGMPSRS